jgi:hypothetical protein
MRKQNSNFFLALGLLATFVLACSFSAGTANLSSMKVGREANEKGELKEETNSFKPTDKVYAVAQVSNNGGKVKVKFRTVVEDAKGLKGGEAINGSEVTLDVDGSRPAIYNLGIPAGFPNGRYRVEAEMLNDKGEKKDEKSATFTVSGGRE